MKQCPLCEGFGYIGKERVIDLTHRVCDLRNKGLTIRQIAKVLGKGPTTIHYHLKRGSKMFLEKKENN